LNNTISGGDYGISALRSVNNTYVGNVINNTNDECITIQTYSGNSTVMDNIMANSIAGSGLFFRTFTSNVKVYNNIFLNNDVAAINIGINSTDFEIVGNRIFCDVTGDGIFLTRGADDNLIKQNYVTRCYSGSQIRDYSNRNLIINNTFNNNRARGIHIQSYSHNNTIVDNVFRDNGGTSVNFAGV